MGVVIEIFSERVRKIRLDNGQCSLWVKKTPEAIKQANQFTLR